MNSFSGPPDKPQRTSAESTLYRFFASNQKPGFGPMRPSSAHPNAAPQLLDCGHFFTAQHSMWPSVCCAGEETFDNRNQVISFGVRIPLERY
jgi:hypothetical protein